MQKMFLMFALCASLGCLSGRGADATRPCGTAVTAESIEQEGPSVPAEPDNPDLGSLIRVDIPPGWTLDNDGGDSAIMSHRDGSRAIIVQRRGGCSGHVAFRQDGMDCVAGFDMRYEDTGSASDVLLMGIEPQPDGTSDAHYFLVGWSEAAAVALHDMFLPDRRQAICTR